MPKQVKKPHVIQVAGVSVVNGQYKLNVSGRLNPLQLFQCAIPGKTTFEFVRLPNIMNKRDAVAYLIEQVPGVGADPNARAFLKELLKKLDAKLNKVPGKPGRPKKNKESAKVAKKEIKAAIVPIEPVKPVKPVVSDAEKTRIMEANRQRLREVSSKMRMAKRV